MATTFTSVTRYQPGPTLWVGGAGGVLDPYAAETEVVVGPADSIIASEFSQQQQSEDAD